MAYQAAESKSAGAVTQAEYARMRGKSRQAVHQRVQEGSLRLDDEGLLDVEEADAATGWAGGEPISPLREAQARKVYWEANLRELKYRQLAGELVWVHEVEHVAFESGRKIRDALLQLPMRVVDSIGEVLDVDAREVLPVLEREVRELLERLSREESFKVSHRSRR